MVALEIVVGTLVAALAGLGIFKVISAAVGALTAAYQFMSGALVGVTAAEGTAAAGAQAMGVSFSTALGPLLLVALGVAAVYAAFKVFSDQGNKVTVDIDALTTALNTQSPVLSELGPKLQQMGETHKFFSETLKQSASAASDLIPYLGLSASETAKYTKAVRDHVVELGKKKVQQDADNAATAQSANDALIAKGGVDALKGAYNEAKVAAQGFKDIIDALNAKYEGTAKAQLDLNSSLLALRKGLVDSKNDWAQNTEAGIKNWEALWKVKDAGDNVYQSMMLAGQGGTLPGSRSSGRHKACMTRLSQRARVTRRHCSLPVSLYGIPGDAFTNIHNTADLARYVAEMYKGSLGGIPGQIGDDGYPRHFAGSQRGSAVTSYNSKE